MGTSASDLCWWKCVGREYKYHKDNIETMLVAGKEDSAEVNAE
jgi:hypothetical protein